MNPRQSSKKSPSQSANEVPNEEPQDYENDLFPVVGIGASAGGVEAFIALLRHLPSNTGMAFVLIQHLSPERESLLSTILARSTQMPVSEAQNGTVVAPNQVYVIPPNATMTIAQGVLNLAPRARTRGVFMSVDAFFISLAADRGNKAIAVVLSGGDSDGARGLEEIKAAGGITFAQCQDTAKVNSMPNTAVATGQVDFILTPQAIGEELAKISLHSYVALPSPIKVVEEPQSEDALQTIFSLLRVATGVDFTHYKQTTLKRRILRRMALYKLEQLELYARYLQENQTEVTALYQDLLINVTSFFRDPEAFDVLKSKVFPKITKDKSPTSPIRVWVAGCSTGEEAYSIAICLLEYLAEQVTKPLIQIYATDVSETVIEKARSGIYKRSQVGDISPERLHRFFVEVEDGYQICKAVREQCVFARQNLISDPPFSRLDLISCRNVLIYLGTPLQTKLLPIFHYGLKPTGFLMLGTSETVGDFLNLFTLIDKKNKIYSRKLAATQLNMEVVTNYYPQETVNQQPQVRENDHDLEMQQEADRIVLNQYAPVGVIINSDFEILQFRGQTSRYLEPAPGKASFNLLKMAKEELRLELRTAVHQVKKHEVPISKSGLQIKESEQVRQVRFEVVPFKISTTGEVYFLVLFEDTPALVPTLIETTTASSSQLVLEQVASNEQEIKRLRQELATTREHLQAIIEEQQATNQDLRAANEEILSSNEELQSTNEELETAKEEIQATNEELNTINDELQRRSIEANQVNNDLQNLLSSTNIPILMLGSDLCIRRFTPLAQRILNLIPTDVGRPLADINHNLNMPDLEKQILEVINTLNVREQEIQDREGHWYDIRIRPYRTIDNKIDGAVVILVDIDALKRSAQQLQASRDYAEAIVETIREPLLVLDKNLHVLTANQSFYSAFQVTPAETLHHSIFQLGNGQWNLPHLRALLEEVLPQNHQIDDFAIEHAFERIGYKTMLLSACKVLQTNNEDMILLAIQDITQRKLLEEQRTQLLSQEQTARTAAELANRTKDEFLSIVSHELRSPLNSVLGWTQLLRTRNVDAAQTAHALELVERSARLQAKLVEDLLDISRITAGNFQINISPIALAPVIEASIALARPSAEAKNLQMQAVLEPRVLQVAGDVDRLQQVIGNLLSNAIKFTPIGGEVTVKLERVGSVAQIQVSDTGQGISAEFLPHVFERFRQADSSSTRVRGGLGLGLAIVRHLVERHAGTVSVASPGEGQGATFLVQLPLLEESRRVEERAEISPSQPLDSASLDGLRLLVVDDDPAMLELLTAILEQHGAGVTTVNSAQEAIAILNANPGEYDLLLSDIGMPQEDGYGLIRQVRAIGAPLGEIPAIALTAYVKVEEQSEFLAAGFQRYITKPVEPARLVSAIVELAGLRGVGEDSRGRA